MTHHVWYSKDANIVHVCIAKKKEFSTYLIFLCGNLCLINTMCYEVQGIRTTVFCCSCGILLFVCLSKIGDN